MVASLLVAVHHDLSCRDIKYVKHANPNSARRDVAAPTQLAGGELPSVRVIRGSFASPAHHLFLCYAVLGQGLAASTNADRTSVDTLKCWEPAEVEGQGVDLGKRIQPPGVPSTCGVYAP